MKIETSKGKRFDIRVICPALRGKNKILIEYADDRSLAEIAQDFDRLDSIVIMDDNMGDGHYEVYEGFSRLVAINQGTEKGFVRVTLERGGTDA